MASIKKHNTRWRAAIDRKGVRKSKVFDTKQAAKDWAAREEYLILNGGPVGRRVTFGHAMDRYAREVSPAKRGARWEQIRLEKIQGDSIADIIIADLLPADLAGWRDARLREVSAGTVNREMVLLSGVLSVSRKEWGYISINPMSDVRKPSRPPPRDRLVTEHELQVMAISAGGDLTIATARVFHAFRFACQTAMRAGEIVKLEWQHVDIEARTAHLPITKNGTSRDVPLSSEAVRLLLELPRADPVFGLNSSQMDVLFRKMRDRAGVVDLTFHDSRHRAITDLAQRLDVLELARAVGHQDIRQLMTYFNAPASDLAKKLI